eukprot:11714069-Alexandrium_andersonii.AAC.1
MVKGSGKRRKVTSSFRAASSAAGVAAPSAEPEVQAQTPSGHTYKKTGNSYIFPHRGQDVRVGRWVPFGEGATRSSFSHAAVCCLPGHSDCKRSASRALS